VTADASGRIEASITVLVQSAPELDATVAIELVGLLRATEGIGQPLALAIARIVELVVDDLVDPGIALPALAMACATLGDVVRGSLGEREASAARYEIETLLPLPGPPGTRLVVPDVPLGRLSRRGN